jgi:hypothetical protein
VFEKCSFRFKPGSIWWLPLAIAGEDVWVSPLQGLALLRFLINEPDVKGRNEYIA